jgi:membrane protein involved in colicin uptake
MKRKALTILISVVVAASLISCAVVLNGQMKVNAATKEARTDLRTSVDMTDYRKAEKKEIQSIIATACDDMESATSEKEVREIEKAAETKISKLKTDAQYDKEEAARKKRIAAKKKKKAAQAAAAAAASQSASQQSGTSSYGSGSYSGGSSYSSGSSGTSSGSSSSGSSSSNSSSSGSGSSSNSGGCVGGDAKNFY